MKRYPNHNPYPRFKNAQKDVHKCTMFMFVRIILCSLWIVCGLSCCELLWVTAQWRRGRQTGRKWGGTNWKWGATNWWLADVVQYDCWAHHQTIKKEVKASMKKHRTQIHCIEPVLVPASRRPQPILIRVPESLELNKSSISLWFILRRKLMQVASMLVRWKIFLERDIVPSFLKFWNIVTSHQFDFWNYLQKMCVETYSHRPIHHKSMKPRLAHFTYNYSLQTQNKLFSDGWHDQQCPFL